MEQQKIDMFIMTNRQYFPADKIVFVKQKLAEMDEDKFMLASAIELKNPTTMLLISLFFGTWGVDRFMLKDAGMGVLKLLTFGCCGILTIVDWFTVQNKTKELNFNNFMMLL